MTDPAASHPTAADQQRAEPPPDDWYGEPQEPPFPDPEEWGAPYGGGDAAAEPVERPAVPTSQLPPPDPEQLRPEAEAALRRLVGRDDAELREDQWRAIEALVVDRRRALVVQRTGWGKSAVYFVATALLRARGAGPTVIVSPLLALMRDQIAAADRAGIHAVTVNSANSGEWSQVYERIASGEVDVLLCSPERLNNPDFRDEVLPRLAASAGLVVVDEAHCISDWGHDFRPDYRRIRTLLADLPTGIPVLATTATANERVTTDVAEQLGSGADVLVLRGGLDRPSLHLAVVQLPDVSTRLAWLVENLSDYGGSGIIYCLTVAAAEQTATQLRAAGYPVASYTGQTDPAEREQLEADLKENRVKALVATSALGMGFDKPDLGFVIHLGAPPSPIAYYQQVGRAGRAVTRADVVLLPAAEDKAIWDYFGSMGFPQASDVRATLAELPRLGEGAISVASLEPLVDLRRNRLEMMLKVLDVDGAVRRVRGGWAGTGEEWEYDADRYQRVEAARLAEQEAMLVYERTDGCRMTFLRRCLDDPELQPDERCGRCDGCGAVTPPGAPAAAAVSAAREGLDVIGVEITPRRQWPPGMKQLGIELSGRIGPDEQPEPGRALARLDGLGWSLPLRELLAGPDGELPVSLRGPLTRLVREWEPSVDVIVAVDSVTRPQLLRHLTSGVAALLTVPVAGAIRPASGSEPGRHDVNSAQRLAGVVRRLPTVDGLDVAGKRVLLVDDSVDSGWTVTYTARLLRLAGATAVLPLVLAQR
ncbi:RecQ family ATP-dependent DNA helicase [Pseudactinotalea terrae]|uniref:RecQ family ATP-dependent DNA helicase n=1 Tax=Pseudactinotalea terrae TaxID=1743262 RepID=UPI0012E321EE|nr:RecQ family ATP-dependent DNA helicase [Pseudactinotalea terrae]